MFWSRLLYLFSIARFSGYVDTHHRDTENTKAVIEERDDLYDWATSPFSPIINQLSTLHDLCVFVVK
jgi:hypothetical protein